MRIADGRVSGGVILGDAGGIGLQERQELLHDSWSGKIVLVNRKAPMGRNPAAGATINLAAKRVVNFRAAKAAKDAIPGAKK